MQYMIFTGTQHSTYKIALLIKETAFIQSRIESHYIKPIQNSISKEVVIAYSLTYNSQNKAPVKLIKESLQDILKACKSQQIETLFVADSAYFKVLVNERKSEPHYGYIKSCAIKGYENIKVILTVNYQAIFYNPDIKDRLDLSITTLQHHYTGQHVNLGVGIIHSANYPKTNNDVIDVLNELHKYKSLTCDIEGYGLGLGYLGSIAFAWDQHNGTAFMMQEDKAHDTKLGLTTRNHRHNLLLEFFKTYKGTIIYHNASYDIKQLIFNLFMNGAYSNYKQAIHGIQTLFKSIHDTKILIYLATNNAQGNHLSLKHNAFEFTGNYAQDDISDISKIPIPQLLEYNLTDTLATRFVFNKFMPQVVADDQLDIYNTLMIPSLKTIVNMELIGMPLGRNTVLKAKDELESIIKQTQTYLNNLDIIKQWEWAKKLENFILGNAKLKTKINPIDKFAESFNPNSNLHVRSLIYDQLGLPIEDKTTTGLAAVGAKTLTKLSNQLISEFNLTEQDLII